MENKNIIIINYHYKFFKDDEKMGKVKKEDIMSILETYDKENLKPIIRASICTGEQVAGFKNIHTGKFNEVMLIRSAEDKKFFMEKYDISENEIIKEW